MQHDQVARAANYIDLNEVARRLGISRRQAEIMLARREIPEPVRLGRLRRWHSGMVDEWLLAAARRAAGIK